jgi:hypothetical protein
VRRAPSSLVFPVKTTAQYTAMTASPGQVVCCTTALNYGLKVYLGGSWYDLVS